MTAQTAPETGVADARAPDEPPAGTVDARPGAGALTMARLDDQLRWYDRRAKDHQRWYQRLKVAQIVIAAAIPVVAAFGGGADIAGLLGALIVIIESLQQLFQFQQNWLRYRAAAQSLESERHLYLAEAGPYAGVSQPAAMLAERVEQLLSGELTAWSADQRDTSASKKQS